MVGDMNIDADITVFRGETVAHDLSATERLAAAYAIAEQAGVLLADYKDIRRGHRLAIYAHMVALLRLSTDEKDEAQYIVALLDSIVSTELLTVLPAQDDPDEPALT